MNYKFDSNHISIKTIIKPIIALVFIFIFIFSINPMNSNSDSIVSAKEIEWDITLEMTGSDGEHSSVIFGEANDASDGPTGLGPSGNDDYDEPLPPLGPGEAYIRAWFDDNLESPFDAMFKDYRKYPDSNKVWNLTVKWSSENDTSTYVTISWDVSEVDNTEYSSMYLYDDQGFVANMTGESSYTFLSSVGIPYNFQVICHGDTISNGDSDTNEANPLISLFIIVIVFIVVVIFVLYWWRIKK